MGCIGFQLNLSKTECLWIFGTCGDKVLPPLVLDRGTAPNGPVHNRGGVILESVFLLEDQVAVVARRAFEHLSVACQFIDL